MKTPARTIKNEKQNYLNADDRRRLRSGYGAIISLIKERSDDIGKANSDKFKSILDDVHNMHHLVKKPREQIADATALLGLVGSVETTLRSGNYGLITPANFVSCLLEKIGQAGGTETHVNAKKHIDWKEFGVLVSPVFRSCGGCSTMLRPMETEYKQRKIHIYKKPRTRRSTKVGPKQYNTDTIMALMFEILREKRTVKLEMLLLNRKFFAQTVENLFALSFLVKDGRVLISVDEKGSHLVSPRNAPHSRAVMFGEVAYSHFIFRLDFCDWKFMKASVAEGEELMPVRNGVKLQCTFQEELVPF